MSHLETMMHFHEWEREKPAMILARELADWKSGWRWWDCLDGWWSLIAVCLRLRSFIFLCINALWLMPTNCDCFRNTSPRGSVSGVKLFVVVLYWAVHWQSVNLPNRFINLHCFSWTIISDSVTVGGKSTYPSISYQVAISSVPHVISFSHRVISVSKISSLVT